VAPLLADGLRRFRIRVQVEVDDRSEDFARVVVRGAGSIDAAARALAITVPEDQHAHVPYAGARVVRADWHDVEGVDVVGPHDDVMRAHQALLDHGAVDDRGAVEAMRIERGIPVQGVDIDDRTIPQEAFLEHDAVSFTKGCFIGQELVCRLDSRGSKAPRYLRRIDLDGDEVPPPGAVVLVDGVDVGVVTSSAHRADGAAVGLAMVKRAVAPPARAELLWEGAHAAGTIVAGTSGGTT
jgi:folate-binding protein YgfZ